ncbi:MAG: hypothetical protein Q9209_001780 [Squamulea sp. 1 TL-2023]
MTGLAEVLLTCFGIRCTRQKELPEAHPLPERPRINGMPYRSSMAGSMYYLGVSPALRSAHAKGIAPTMGQEASLTEASQLQSPMDRIVACDKGHTDRGFSSECQHSHPLGAASQHIRFHSDMPTRASQFAVVDPSPIDDPAFAISSPGDVSPIALDSSPTTIAVKDDSLQAPGTMDTDRQDKKPFQAVSAPTQLTLQQPQCYRPSLTVKIPISTRGLPVEVNHQSASGNSECSPSSAKTSPMDTPAHARRLPVQAGTRAAKDPKRMNLEDELAALSLSAEEE